MRSRTLLWSTILVDFFATFLALAMVLLPIFANDILHVGPQGLGFLYAAPSIGAILAVFLMTLKGQIRFQGKTLLFAVALFGLATLLFSWNYGSFGSCIEKLSGNRLETIAHFLRSIGSCTSAS